MYSKFTFGNFIRVLHTSCACSTKQNSNKMHSQIYSWSVCHLLQSCHYNHTLVYNWRHYWAHQKQFCKSTPVYTHRYITNLLDSLDTQFHEWLQNETLATYTGHVWSQDGWILIDQDLVFACLQPDTCAVKVPKYEISSHCDAISIFSEGFVICQGTSFSCRTRQSISSGQDNPILPSQVAYGALQTLRIVKGKQLHYY